ncbi:S-layer homology domain-containing protein [Pseudoflavonifractor sp. P01025]|uniref:S-layer homology domain-containing protein n=1 Tax=Flintibacter porci TaxID=3342383 RepID=UPI0035B5B012
MYFSLSVPDNVTTIASDGFRDSYSSEKTNNGAVTYNNNLGRYNVVAIDFSDATSLTTIKSQAAMGCSNLSGVLDLSNTKVETIGKNAFKECTGLTGVILPNTLKSIGSDNAGSVFYGCISLEYVRAVDGAPNAVFELPKTLEYLGNQSFYKCTGLPAGTTIEIPASVTYMGSEVFHYTPSVTTIVVKATDASNYNGGAFKGDKYGLGKRLTVFNNSAAKKTFVPSGSGLYTNSLTYEFTLHYGEEGSTDVKTEPKLYGQAVNVCKTDGVWAVDENYVIPEAELPEPVVGYTGGWAYKDKLLTPKTILKPDGDDLYLDIQNVLQNPTIEFIVNGDVVKTTDTYPEFQVPAGSTIGVQVSHPLENAEDSDVKVKFEYEWTDVWDGGKEGPRMKEDGFGRYNLWDNPDVKNIITINGLKDERTTSENYTGENYGDGYYLVEIYGYSCPKSGGEWKLFYKSASTVIGSDPDRTVNTAYLFDVTVSENPITVTPVDITVYMGGEQGSNHITEDGTIITNSTSLPEFGFRFAGNDGLNPMDIQFREEGTGKAWNVVKYNSTAEDIYKIVPAVGGQDPVRLLFTDDTGKAIVSDEFTVGVEVNKHFNMGIYSGGVDQKKVYAVNKKTGERIEFYNVETKTGILNVRGTTKDVQYADLNQTVELGKPGVSASKDTKFTINNGSVEVVDTSGIALLFDNIIESTSSESNRTQLLEARAAKALDELNKPVASNMVRNYDMKYLDLVDRHNGNTWVKASKDVTVSWPYPAGTDKNTGFTLLHFEGLHRDMASNEVAADIASCTVSTVTNIRKTDTHIEFEIGTGGFSPFALVWESTKPVDPNPGTRDDYTLHYVTNGGKHLSSETKSSAWTKDYEDLPIPVRDGYTFEGWYWDLRLTEPVTGDVKVDKTTVTLYAKWSGGSYGPDDTGVSDWLETDEHNAFLSGYPDGSFQADKNMTRAEVAQMFYALLLDKNVTITKSFSDVPSDAWYAKAVNTLSSLGMLGGYPDGTFRPDAPITRAEFAAIALAFAYDPASASCSYTDVSANAWYYTYVAQATTYGWIGGYPDGSFRPNNSITRAEVAVIVNNMLGRDADESYINRNADELVSFVDLSKNHWAYYTIMESTNSHDYTASSNGESWKA